MRRPRILVVYFSRTGNTRKVAEAIARSRGAVIDELIDTVDRRGLFGYLRSGYEATRQRQTVLKPWNEDPSQYDLVFVGGPVWNASVCAPIRTYLCKNTERLPKVAFFATFGGRGAERAFRQMESLCERKPVTTLALREADLTKGDTPERIDAFARFATPHIDEEVEELSPAPSSAVEIETVVN
jgi:flavodoxin